MTRRIAVVTTFSLDGWNSYAERMVVTWVQNWPASVDLYLYPDELVPFPNRPNVYMVRDEIEAKTKFIRRHVGLPQYRGQNPQTGAYNYRFDAVKFCHKPFALQHCAQNYLIPGEYDAMVWLDADTITHSRIDDRALELIAPPKWDMQFLGRCYKYTECGYLYFNLKAQPALDVLHGWVRYYTKGTFAEQKEWHDSFLFDLARIDVTTLTAKDLTGHLPQRKGAGHPMLNCFLGQYMDHLKGNARKITGKPRKGDLFIDHGPNSYWDTLNPHAKAKPKKPA